MWGGIINRINMLVAEKQVTGKTGTHQIADPDNIITPKFDTQISKKFSIFDDHVSVFSTTNNGNSFGFEMDNRHIKQPSQKSLRQQPHLLKTGIAVPEFRFILTDNQLKQADMRFYQQLNDPRFDRSDSTLATITVDQKLLEGFMLVVEELKSIISSQDKPMLTIPGQMNLLESFKTENEQSAVSDWFKQNSKLLFAETLNENKYDLENKLFNLKLFVEKLQLEDKEGKAANMQKCLLFSYANLELANNSLSKIRKQRYCLMEIKKNGTEIISIRGKIERKKQMDSLLAIYLKFQERFRKMNLMIGQKFSVERACNIYNNLMVGLIYCCKKLSSGLDLIMLRVFRQKLDDRLAYTRQKLSQNLYFELRMHKGCPERFNRQNLTLIIRQMISIEELAKSFLTNPNLKTKLILEILRKDEFMLRGLFKHGGDDIEVFGDSEVKSLVVGIYKDIVNHAGRNK